MIFCHMGKDYDFLNHFCVCYTCVGDIFMQAFVWAQILYYT
jgi:hypothetical protein